MSKIETSGQGGRVLEGTWEEIARQTDQFSGQRGRMTLLPLVPEANGTEGAPFYETATPFEWAEAFFAWAHGHPPRDAPPLSDEAISCESIYGERLDRQR